MCAAVIRLPQSKSFIFGQQADQQFVEYADTCARAELSRQLIGTSKYRTQVPAEVPGLVETHQTPALKLQFFHNGDSSSVILELSH